MPTTDISEMFENIRFSKGMNPERRTIALFCVMFEHLYFSFLAFFLKLYTFRIIPRLFPLLSEESFFLRNYWCHTSRQVIETGKVP